MIRAISPQRLLEQAERLARGPGGRGQPRNADLRRAASSAYYALFHAFTLMAVSSLGSGSARDHKLRLARSYDHGSLAIVCRAVAGTQSFPRSAPHRPVADDLRLDARIVQICESFVDLQQRRHEADYDHLADFSRPDTLALVGQARRSVEQLDAVAGTARGDALFLLVSLQARPPK